MNRWLIIFILFTIIVICLLNILNERDSKNHTVVNQPKKQVEWVPQTEPKIEDTYSRLPPNTTESITILRNKGRDVRKYISQFPLYPSLQLLPPRDKGTYASLGERQTIESLELIFPGYTFNKIRPNWLKNPSTGRCLELDGYNEDLQIAVEYNGEQHYKWPNFTGISEEDFNKQRERDQLKVDICNSKQICLLRIPYTVPLERIPLAVYSKLIDSARVDQPDSNQTNKEEK